MEVVKLEAKLTEIQSKKLYVVDVTYKDLAGNLINKTYFAKPDNIEYISQFFEKASDKILKETLNIKDTKSVKAEEETPTKKFSKSKSSNQEKIKDYVDNISDIQKEYLKSVENTNKEYSQKMENINKAYVKKMDELNKAPTNQEEAQKFIEKYVTTIEQTYQKAKENQKDEYDAKGFVQGVKKELNIEILPEKLVQKINNAVDQYHLKNIYNRFNEAINKYNDEQKTQVMQAIENKAKEFNVSMNFITQKAKGRDLSL